MMGGPFDERTKPVKGSFPSWVLRRRAADCWLRVFAERLTCLGRMLGFGENLVSFCGSVAFLVFLPVPIDRLKVSFGPSS